MTSNMSLTAAAEDNFLCDRKDQEQYDSDSSEHEIDLYVEDAESSSQEDCSETLQGLASKTTKTSGIGLSASSEQDYPSPTYRPHKITAELNDDLSHVVDSCLQVHFGDISAKDLDFQKQAVNQLGSTVSKTDEDERGSREEGLTRENQADVKDASDYQKTSLGVSKFQKDYTMNLHQEHSSGESGAAFSINLTYPEIYGSDSNESLYRNSDSRKMSTSDDKIVGFNSVKAGSKRLLTSETPYKCDICCISYSKNYHLQRHIALHGRETNYKCNTCYASFPKSCHLERHMKLHIGEKPYRCDICGAEFNHSRNLTRHNRIHTGEKPYRCDVCNVEFNNSYSLTRHQRIHTGEKPYRCDSCGVGFKQASCLARHRRVHTGERRYKSDVCGISFEEKHYKCDICGTKFIEASALSRHQRAHTREKRYKCDVCNREFNNNGSLATHLRAHSADKPHKCDVCKVGFNRRRDLTAHQRKHVGDSF